MSDNNTPVRAMGLDFGTTNTVVALSDARGGAELISFRRGDADTGPFRSALCYWADDEGGRTRLRHDAGPWAIDEYRAYPQDSRFIQSSKSVAASPNADPWVRV